MTPHNVLNRWYTGKTLIFGHRGAKAYAPMNTIPAFELAARQGADGIELDVWLSEDGHPVVIHDDTLEGTTDGTGYVQEYTLAELQALDAGGWFAPEFTATRIPTLDSVFAAVGHKLLVNVEIKAAAAPQPGIERAVADCIVRHRMAERVLVSSFDPHILRTFRTLLPDVPLGYLYAPAEMGSVNGITHEARHPYFGMIDSAFMDWAQTHGFVVNTWTVNEPADIKRMLALGVHGIITDAPDVALGVQCAMDG